MLPLRMHCAQLCLTLATPWTVARQAPLSMGFSRQEHWSGLPCPSPGELPDPGVEPTSPALQVGSLLLVHPGGSQGVSGPSISESPSDHNGHQAAPSVQAHHATSLGPLKTGMRCRGAWPEAPSRDTQSWPEHCPLARRGLCEGGRGGQGYLYCSFLMSSSGVMKVL